MRTAELRVGRRVYHVLHARDGALHWARCLETGTWTVGARAEAALGRMQRQLLEREQQGWHGALRPLPRSWAWRRRWERLRALMHRGHADRGQAGAGAQLDHP